MNHYRSVFCLLISILFLTGCSKSDQTGGNSKVTFQMPEGFGNGAFAGTACFAVNITASDIPSVSPGVCDASYGVFGGLIPAGGEIELEAKFGNSRTIDIYYVISNNGCNQFDPALGLGHTYGSNKVFRISRTEGVDFNKPEVIVEAQIEWPRASNSFKNLLSSPASCDKGDDPLNLMAIKQARLIMGSYRGTTNTGSKVHVRVLDKKIDLSNYNNWSKKIRPVRLGVEQ